MTATLSQKVRFQIAIEILSGQISADTRLDEESIARRMGVSRTPVREALRELSVLGLVQTRPHCGGQVVASPFENVTNLLKVLEIHCACIAAERGDMHAHMAQWCLDGADWRKNLWQIAQNEPMAHLLSQYWQYLDPCLKPSQHDPLLAHKVMDCILNGDRGGTCRAMAKYLDQLYRFVTPALVEPVLAE